MASLHGASLSPEVAAAYRLLFGGVETVSGDETFRQALRSAFRKKARETHPDRARALGVPAAILSARFVELRAAYEVLERVAEGGAGSDSPVPASPEPASTGFHYYSGPFPRRRLRLAEYLYYARSIPWEALIGAITWQRMARPTLGRLAVEWGLLSPEDVERVLSAQTAALRRRTSERLPFGECAVTLGLLTPFQRLALVARQRELTPLIGRYFVAQGFLSDAELLAALRLCERQPTSSASPFAR
jgi:hypothetical protein